ncbi:MAG: dTDP-4-amino-4,6-dideoxyglucose formyltransferase [Vicingaceae bacterium]
MKKILLLTDNEELLTRFKSLIREKGLSESSSYEFEYCFSPQNKVFIEKYRTVKWIRPLNVKNEVDFLSETYDLIISLHCKQIFPAALVNKVRCINIHPGLNPHNRGWYPQVFSILNGLPAGATIHEIDEDLDHGPVICQKEVKVESWDTSITVYNKVLDVELDLLNQKIIAILNGTYKTFTVGEGNLNLKKDFNSLCKLNLDEKDTFRNHINRLRALTHGDYSNAFFIDEEGNKVHLKIQLDRTNN